MKRIRSLRADAGGFATVEFAFAVPILILVIWGIFQIGLLFEANAGMQHALGEGARYATLYDYSTPDHMPADEDIKARMTAKLFGTGGGTFNVEDPVDGNGFKTLTITYSRTMDFLLFKGPTIKFSRSKKVYTVS
jgi:Flp pilus assembly protein TadG